jgi:uncharacterized protein (DUF433 family)
MKTMKKSSPQLSQLFAANPKIRFGKSTIIGTRIAAEDILNLLDNGFTVDEISQQLPKLKPAVVKQVLRLI